MKICPKCKNSIEEASYGKSWECKACRHAYYLANAEEIKIKRRLYHFLKNGRKHREPSVPWNKGVKTPTNTGRTRFKKGMVPWNKGIKRNQTRYVNKGGVWEHRRVMEAFLERKLMRGEQVHHVDGDRANNVIENLVVCPNQKSHRLLHTEGLKTKDECVWFINWYLATHPSLEWKYLKV